MSFCGNEDVMQRFQRVWGLFFLLVYLMCASNVNADRIYLKDGTVVVSDKVWHSRNYVHFILKGTKNVEIRYAKAIVAKIESQGESFNPTPPPQTMVSPDNSVNKELEAGKNAVPDAIPVQPSQADVRLDKSDVSSNRGLSFYDPRREKRYWASRDSRHDSLDGVLQALSRQYGRTPQWVASHMGEENNLSEIHANLIQRRESETSEAVKSSDPAMDKDLNSEAPSSGGLEFYHPRRKQKYWTGKMERYNTYQEALQALAKQYGVSTEWIESNMGDTNNLNTIHQNIRESLK
jgi:ribonuclease HI